MRRFASCATRSPAWGSRGELVRGKPAQALLDRSTDAALVVVGNQSRSRVGRLVMGSVSNAVVTHAELPVVLVRSDVRRDGEAWREGPVVVGVDGSAGSEAAVAFAFEATTRHGLTLVAVHTTDDQVLSAATSSPAGTVSVSHPPSAKLLEMSPALKAGRLEYPAVDVTEMFLTGRASDNIVTAASSAALTVVGSRGTEGSVACCSARSAAPSSSTRHHLSRSCPCASDARLRVYHALRSGSAYAPRGKPHPIDRIPATGLTPEGSRHCAGPAAASEPLSRATRSGSPAFEFGALTATLLPTAIDRIRRPTAPSERGDARAPDAQIGPSDASRRTRQAAAVRSSR